jgi:hypothetical protein
MNVDHISNEKRIYYHPKPQKSELENLGENAFSARQNTFSVNDQNLMKHITGTFPISFYLHFRSSKLGTC